MRGILTTDPAAVGQGYEAIVRTQGGALKVQSLARDDVLPSPVLEAELYDDFQSATPVSNPGAGTVVQGGIGDTNWLLVTVDITAGTPWLARPTSTGAGAIGEGRLQTGGVNTVASICRGLSPTDLTVCRARDIARLDYLVDLDTQDSLTSGLFHFCGLNSDWAAFSGVMGVARDLNSTGNNWVVRRSGQPNIDTGVSALSANGPWLFRFEQIPDPSPPANELPQGSGRWNLSIANPASPSLASPIVADFDGGAVGGVPTAPCNYGAQVQKFAAAGVQTNFDIDLVGFTAFAKTLAQRIAS
jgi:hypothetical protein